MASKVVIGEREILQLLRDFLEETKRTECLFTFEKCTGSHPMNLREEFVKLRRVCLFGDLDLLQERVFEPFRTLGYDQDVHRCKYAIAKQQYLENLVELSPENSEMLKKRLVEAEILCPSVEEFKVLLSLLTLPSFDESPEYKGWTIQKGRLECFYLLKSWLSKLLDENTSESTKLTASSQPDSIDNLSKSRLVQLVAKGLIYEKCEAICANSQAEENRESGKVLDLYNWIKQQPDSAFQLSPTSMELTVTTEPWERKISNTGQLKEEQQEVVLVTEESTDSQKNMESNQQSFSAPNVSETYTTVEKESKDKEQSAVGEADESVSDGAKDKSENSSIKNVTDSDNASNGNDNLLDPKKLPKDMMKFDDNFVDAATQRLETGSSHLVDNKPVTDKSMNAKSEANLVERIVHREAIPSSTSAPALTVQLTADALKISSSGLAVKETPEIHKIKKGRKSSTPKPSSSKQLTQQLSPSTSPVPYVPPSRRFMPEEQEQKRQTYTAKKLINFSENDESIVFPTAQILAQVKDQQVVRSVAFSESGNIVAIGANSRTLHLCYTESLFQESSRGDEILPEFYCAQHYHKGSVYCLAWLGDSLLVSGSNDQTIRLLSYHPTSQASTPCTSLGQLKIHKGTIRDLAFTSNGLLISGGVGDNLIKISNPETFQVVNTLFGHYDQILGLYVVKENIIASASQDKTVKLWDVRLGQVFASIKHPHSVTSVAASTNLNQIASAQLDGSCVIHDLNTLKQISTYNAHSDECRTVRYSCFDQGQWLLSSSYDGTICLADTNTFEWQQVAQHRDKVVQCRWHGSAPIFASTGADNRACFWRVAS